MEFSIGRILMFRTPTGVDLIDYLAKVVEKEKISTGLISIIGSLKDPVIGYYNIEKGVYEETRLQGFYELAHGSGNISLKGGKPFIHLHVVLGDKDGKAYAGHLLKGEVYVAEVIILEAIGGKPLVRKQHGNLWLWDTYTV